MILDYIGLLGRIKSLIAAHIYFIKKVQVRTFVSSMAPVKAQILTLLAPMFGHKPDDV